MPYIDINGAHIYYEIAGQGAAVTLLHAGIADRRMWDGQFAVLEQHYRVLRYDLRGYGLTEAEPMPFTHHDDLLSLMDFLGIDRTALVGCSNGGRVAMDFALTYPDRATALVMVGSAPGGYEYPGELPAAWQELIQAHAAGDLERTSALETRLWAVGLGRSKDQVDKAIRDLVSEMNMISLKKEPAASMERPFTPPAIQRLRELRVPTLIVIGDEDSPSTLAAGKVMQAEIAGSRMVTMTDSAHLPNMEHPDEFNQLLLRFLDAAASS